MVEFPLVRQTVVVVVRIAGVEQAVAVEIRFREGGIRALLILDEIRAPVAIGVRGSVGGIQRIELVLRLPDIRQAIVIVVGIEDIRRSVAVEIGFREGGIRALLILDEIRAPVPIEIAGAVRGIQRIEAVL
jgi:hypothetical protein